MGKASDFCLQEGHLVLSKIIAEGAVHTGIVICNALDRIKQLCANITCQYAVGDLKIIINGCGLSS